MNPFLKKIIIGIIVLIILCPIGLILPEAFKAGDAWGEWSTEKIKEELGYVPQGMTKNESLWSAPIPDYSLNPEDESLVKQSVYYILSAIIGVGVVLVITFSLSKIAKKEE